MDINVRNDCGMVHLEVRNDGDLFFIIIILVFFYIVELSKKSARC